MDLSRYLFDEVIDGPWEARHARLSQAVRQHVQSKVVHLTHTTHRGTEASRDEGEGGIVERVRIRREGQDTYYTYTYIGVFICI